MPTRPRVLLLDAAPEAARALDERLRALGVTTERVALAPGTRPDAAARADLAVVMVAPDPAPAAAGQLTALIRGLAENDTATIVWGAGHPPHHGSPYVEWLAPDVGLDELVGKVGTLARYAPLMKGLERELQHLQKLGQQLNRQFGEIDQEMRLAGRLQRDFLPRELPRVKGYQFDVIFRPASWVSGDLYDVFRIDTSHFGIFIADAMGHGVAAGLLTMFLRQALVAKRVAGSESTIVSPSEALTNLHQCLLRQQLPSCQFVTAAYAILDIMTDRIRLARAGHPYPIHVAADRNLREVVTGGSLFGLADVPAEFDETEVTLAPGEKLVLYTDGMEDLFIATRGDNDRTNFTERLHRWAALPAREFTATVQEALDHTEGSLNPADDVTLLVIEALR